jgi:hypothetical protein
MSTKVLAQSATDLASHGFDLDSYDTTRITSIVRAQASTKQGGFNFQPGVLFTKVCKEIKSLANLNKGAQLPEKLARLINDAIQALPEVELKSLHKEGFQLIKQSGVKLNVSTRDMTVTNRVLQTYEQLPSLENQAKDLGFMVFMMREKVSKLNLEVPRDMNHRMRIENAIDSINKKIVTYERLHKVLKMEIEEQRKALVKEEAK